MNAHRYPPKLAEMLELFETIEDRSDRIDALISLADRFEEVPERVAQRPFPERNRVPHCESEAFVFTEPLGDGTLAYHFAVENPQGISAMATAAILARTVSGEPLEEVARLSPEFVYQLFGRELSTGKGLGLTGIVSMVQHAARRQLEKAGGGAAS